jgi:hypothetical protein
MPGHDDHDLERRLREQRSEAHEEFVQNLSAEVRGRRSASPRPRLTLAFVLTGAMLVSLVAFGGVGAASSAIHSSASAVRSAVGEPHKARGSKSHSTPATKQYHQKVSVCYPGVHYTVTYTWVTKDKWVWKWEKKQNHRGHWIRVKVPVQVKVKERVKTISYFKKTVSDKRLPDLVAKGAIFPVPAEGCSSLDTGTPV